MFHRQHYFAGFLPIEAERPNIIYAGRYRNSGTHHMGRAQKYPSTPITQQGIQLPTTGAAFRKY